MDEQAKAAFASASESCKQLIALATGLIGLEITFAKELIKELDYVSKVLIGCSWFFLLVSVIAGVWALLALTGSLGSFSAATQKSIFKTNVRVPAIAQILLFLIGLILTVVFGIRGIF